jgi:tetratricopeptide (TPR) repeat protein
MKTSNIKIGGDIVLLHLEDWWLGSFTEEERKHMVEIYQPMGAPKDMLITGDFKSDIRPLNFLTSLTGWFDNPKDRQLAYRIIAKAEEYINSKESTVLDLHFFYPTKMKLFYKERENPVALDEAINCCIKQIELAPDAAKVFLKDYGNRGLPTHEGYDQLCIIYYKQGKFEEAIKIAKQAKEQGWCGNWDDCIPRYKNKLNSSGQEK